MHHKTNWSISGWIILTGLLRYATLHSEPNINESIIFISIVLGSGDEIDELEKRWVK